jgi:hypothetical protein
MHCEQCLINFLTVDNFHAISEHAELYNTERLREYCSWFYRRHAPFIVTQEMQHLSLDDKGEKYPKDEEEEEEEEEEE